MMPTFEHALCVNTLFACKYDRFDNFSTSNREIMQLSHLSRLDHDWYRGLQRGPIRTIVSNLIRSHHILMSIVIIGLIVENFLSAKTFATITTIGGTIVTIASDRMTS